MIYSKFERESIDDVEFQRLARSIATTYIIPYIICKKIVINHSHKDDHKLSKYEYEDIMTQLYIIDNEVLANRVKIFKNCDSNKDGYIDEKELPELFRILGYNKYEFCEVIGLKSVEICMQHYDKNNDKYLNFLDFNEYMNDTYYFHYK